MTDNAALLSIPLYDYVVISNFLESHPGRGGVDQEPIEKIAKNKRETARRGRHSVLTVSRSRGIQSHCTLLEVMIQ